jgi:hypothetical protein
VQSTAVEALIRSFIALGAIRMSQQVREWKRPKAEKRNSKEEAQYAAWREGKLSEMAVSIKESLKRRKNNGVVFADTYELLLLMLALEIQHGPGAKSLEQHMQEYYQFYAGIKDVRTGRRKLMQGDSQALMRDAVKLAVSRGFVCEHKDSDSEMAAIYLPTDEASTWTQPKWTVFFTKADRVVENYVPSKRVLDAYMKADTFDTSHHESEYVPTGRDLALLKRWGEQFSH